MNRHKAVLFNFGVKRRSTALRGPRILAFVAVALASSLLSGTLVRGGQMFWTDDSTFGIMRANADGSSRTAIVSNLPYQPEGIAVDSLGGKVYWTGWGVPGIHRANLDGTQNETILPAFISPHVAVDAVHSKLILESDSGDSAVSFYKCNYDGSNLQLMFTYGQGGTWDFAVDAAAGKIYWTTDKPGAFPQQTITRANLDGTQIQTLVSGLRYGYMALDPQGGKMYWETNDTANRKIQRANLDGSGVQTLLTQANIPGTDTFLPRSMAIDLANHQLYFANDVFQADNVYRANLDGSGLQFALDPGTSGLAELALIPTAVPEPSTPILLAVCGLALSATSIRNPLRR